MLSTATIYGRSFKEGVLADGTAVTVLMNGCGLPCTVWVSPASGDTVSVTYKTSPNVSAVAWPSGPATGYTEDVLDGPVYSITFQRTAGAGTTSRYGVAT